MNRSTFLIAVAMVTVFFVSCKNSGTSGLAIPKDAAMVLHINTSSLTSKLSWQEIKETSWFKEMSQKQNDTLAKKILDNPDSSGVDLKSDFVFFMKKQGKGGYMVFEGNLKDAAAFEAMLKNMNDSSEVQKDGDLKFMKTGKDNIVSWTDSKFITMSDAPFFNQMNVFTRQNNEENISFTVDSLKKFTKDLLSLKSDNSIEKDDRFSSLVKESGDVHFWVNSEQYTSGLGGGMLSMLKIGSLLQGNVSTFTLNFDNGKVSVKSKQYFGPELTKLMDQYSTKPVSASVINRIPSQNVIGVLAMNIDPEGIKGFLKASGLDGMANGYLSQLNLTLDEIIQATKGQFLIAVSDLNFVRQAGYSQMAMVERPTTMDSKTDVNILFATSVNNRQSFEKLLGIAKQQMSGADSSKVKLKVTDEWFVASNKTETADKFLAGGNNNLSFADKISGHPFGLYVDIQKFIKSRQLKLKNSYDSAVYDANLKLWQDIVATGGEYKNGTSTGEFVLNLVDKSTNSLKQLNLFADKMATNRESAAQNMTIILLRILL